MISVVCSIISTNSCATGSDQDASDAARGRPTARGKGVERGPRTAASRVSDHPVYPSTDHLSGTQVADAEIAELCQNFPWADINLIQVG